MNKTTAPPPYRLYAGMLAGLIAVRFVDLLTSHTEFAAAVYASNKWRVGLGIAAFAITLGTSMYVRHRVPKLMALLLCVLVGGATTLLTASYVGATIGLFVAVFSLFDRPRSIARRCGKVAANVVRPVVPACVVGFVTGGIAWILTAPFGFSSGRPITIVASVIVSGVIVWGLVARLLRPRRKWYGWIGGLAVFSAWCVVGFFLVAWQDGLRRRRAVVPRIYVTRNTWMGVLSPTTLRTMIWPGVSLGFSKDCTDEDVRYMTGFPFIDSIYIEEGVQISGQELARLRFEHLIEFSSMGESRISDEFAPQLRNSRKLQSLQLSGDQFTDDTLCAFGRLPNLAFLSLANTRVTSSELGRLLGPATWYVDLRNTDVDDDVFAVIARCAALQHVVLRDTSVTGSGLKNLRGKAVGGLDLSNTPLDEKYLADLLDEVEQDDEVLKQANLQRLNLGGIRISSVGVRAIGDMRWLTSLDIPDADVDDTTIRPLAKLQGLQDLSIAADRLTPAGLACLAPASKLRLCFDAGTRDIHHICEQARLLAESHRDRIQQLPYAQTSSPDISVTIKNLDITQGNVDEVATVLQGFRREIYFQSARIFGGQAADYGDVEDLLKKVGNGGSNESTEPATTSGVD